MIVPSEPAVSPPSSGVMLRGDGRVSVGRRGAGVLVCRLVGHLERQHLEWLLAELDRHVGDQVHLVFVDASRLQSCVPSFTDTFGSWADEHAELRSLHLLTNTSVIEAEVPALRHALEGRLVHHMEPERFHAVLLDLIG